jgi:hypothetical protein
VTKLQALPLIMSMRVKDWTSSASSSEEVARCDDDRALYVLCLVVEDLKLARA